MAIKTIKVYWERTNLHITLSEKIKTAYIESKQNKISLEHKENELVLSFYNLPEGTMLPAGEYHLIINDQIVQIEDNLYKELDSLARINKYKDIYAYTVDLTVNTEKELIITTEFYIKNLNPKSETSIKHHRTLNRKIKAIIKIVAKFMINAFYRLIHLFSCPKRVLFLSENSNELTVNLKPLKDSLDSDNIYKTKTFTKNTFKHRSSKLLRLKEIIEIALARYVVIDNYTPIFTYLRLSKNTKLVQLWHAAIGFKSVGYARFGRSGSPHPYISGHRYLDYVIVDSEPLIEVYQEVFGIQKEKIYPYGLPRLDNFLDKDIISKTKEKLLKEYPEFGNKKIILYAPTYRGNGQKDAFYDMEKIPTKELYDYCKNNNAIVVFKFHPFTNNKLEIKEKYKSHLIDLTSYQNFNELLYITDILVTDYSSCAYEASLLDIPILFYRYDKYEYEYIRGIHTADIFTSQTTEITNELEIIKEISILMSYKRKEIKYQKRDSIKKIQKEIFGENK